MFALLFASLIGCTPQDATLSGDWFVWLAAQSSATIEEDALALESSTVFSCNGKGWLQDECGFDEKYFGPKNGYSDSDKFIGGDCKRAEGSVAGICDGDFIDNCGATEDLNEDGVVDGADAIYGFAEECKYIDNAEFQTWMKDDAYYGMTGKIGEYKNAEGELVNDTWRSEAIINSEGDLQLTVHVDLGQKCWTNKDGDEECNEPQDFRFHFSIDPDFEPIECRTDEDDKAVVEHVDGSSWVDEWSEDEDGYRIFYLNSGSYQVNPNDSETWWYLNNEALSGWGFAKFAAEEFYSHAGRYGNYDEEGNGQGFLGITDHESPDMSEYATAIDDLCEVVYGWDCPAMQTDDDGDGASEAEGDCDDDSATITVDDCPDRDSEDEPLSWQDEMIVMAGAAKNKEAKFQHKIENNTWRPIDETITGLDGWMEVHSSWVRIKNGSKVEEGGKVSGDFQVLYDGAESGSRLLITGEFSVDDLREDQWGYEILEDAKRKENDTPFCGGAGE
jgi:hypothetical protein